MVYYGFIYITTNLINGKKYIGQHALYNRNGELKEDFKHYKGSGSLIKKAIKKYGVKNFTRDIVYFARSKEELDLAEINFIKYHNAIYSDDYYNLAEGGNGNIFAGYSNERMDEYKQTCRDKYKDIDFYNNWYHSVCSSWTDDRRKKHKDIVKKSHQNNPHMKEKRIQLNHEMWINEETREKQIESMSKKPLVQLDFKGDLIDEFLNSNIAAKSIGVKDGSAIRACCRGDRKQYKGFIWMYKSEYENSKNKSA